MSSRSRYLLDRWPWWLLGWWALRRRWSAWYQVGNFFQWSLPSLKLIVCTWKWMVGILGSFWEGLFSGFMLVLGSVIGTPFWRIKQPVGIQSYCQGLIGVSNHILSIVFRLHYHSQKVIGSLGNTNIWWFWRMFCLYVLFGLVIYLPLF